MSLRRRACVPPVPKMPPGLIELMDGLARDVLKNNPENIFEFCAHHMEKLLEIRDGHATKPFITLEQKIAKAQKKVNQRAELRRRAYDEKVRVISKDSLNAQVPRKTNIDDAKNDAVEENETVTVKDKEEEKQQIEQQELVEPCDDSEVMAVELKSTEEMLITANDESKEDEENEPANQNNCNVDKEDEFVNNVNASGDDIIILISDDNQNSDIIEANETSQGPENNLLIESHEVTMSENVVTNSDIKIEDKNDVHNLEGDAPDLQIENNIDVDEKTMAEKQNVQLNDDIEVIAETEIEIKTETETENKIHAEIDNSLTHDSNDEVSLKETECLNKETPPPIVTDSDKISNADFDNTCTTTDQNNVQEDQSLINNSSNSDVRKEDLKESKSDSVQDTPVDDLCESERKVEDDKILAVILSTKSPESDPVQNTDLESIQSSEPEHKKEDILEKDPEPTEDKIHNNNTSMDLETAAITIQKVFRSFLFKTKTASYDDSTTVDMNILNEDKEKDENDGLNVNIKDRRHLGISRMDTVLQTVNEEKSLSLSTDDSSTLSSAATIIQAHVRGFLVRNKYNLNKTISSNSLIDSDAPSIPSLEADSENRKSKTVLNIHIVPEGGHFVSRDESLLTSMDLSLDGSPPSSVNLHPLGYDKSERRKQLKREDAVQSVSPPSNNSGKLSDDVDSVKEVLTIDNNTETGQTIGEVNNSATDVPVNSINEEDEVVKNSDGLNIEKSASDAADEMDVVTPFMSTEDRSSRESNNSSKLLHSGEFHDVIVPTNVTRSDTSVVREFQNVLVYFILWNN